ncbi:MAG TPA: hypothetical protein VNY07_07750 [Chthoniobacterales bacterium]|jgi:hypothetical protein|nr:hypothetical protein [Chthoniobacterales bacterium]
MKKKKFPMRNFGGQDLAEPGCLTTNEYVERCWWAHETADQLREAMRSYKRASGDIGKPNKWWFNLFTNSRAIARATDDLFCFAGLLDDGIEDGSDLAGSLRLVVDALEGKRRGGKDDERLLGAYFKASETHCPPFLSEVYAADIDIQKSKWVDTRATWKKLNKDAMRRRFEILGCPLSPDPRSGWRQPKEQKAEKTATVSNCSKDRGKGESFALKAATLDKAKRRRATDSAND